MESSSETLFKAQWEEEQEELSKQLILDDDFCWKTQVADPQNATSSQYDEAYPNVGSLRYIGGVDISFVKDSNVHACAALVILEYPSMEVLYEATSYFKLTLPYIPGFLAFREVPALLGLIDELRLSHPDLQPDLIFVDGNGIFHPRGFGLACHLGVLAGIPTIGVAKTFFNVDGLTKSWSKDHASEIEAEREVSIVGLSGKIWGSAVCPVPNVTNPVYVSIGHRVSLKTTVKLVFLCSHYRVPEPIRQADLRSRKVIASWNIADEDSFTRHKYVWRKVP